MYPCRGHPFLHQHYSSSKNFSYSFNSCPCSCPLPFSEAPFSFCRWTLLDLFLACFLLYYLFLGVDFDLYVSQSLRNLNLSISSAFYLNLQNSELILFFNNYSIFPLCGNSHFFLFKRSWHMFTWLNNNSQWLIKCWFY